MTDTITLSRAQVSEIVKALDGIGELLKRLPSKPETAGVMYSIISNIAVIQTTLAGLPRVTSN